MWVPQNWNMEGEKKDSNLLKRTCRGQERHKQRPCQKQNQANAMIKKISRLNGCYQLRNSITRWMRINQSKGWEEDDEGLVLQVQPANASPASNCHSRNQM